MEILSGNEERTEKKLMKIIENCVKYFNDHDKCHELSKQLEILKENFEICQKNFHEIQSFSSEYDIDEDTLENGFRSFVAVFNTSSEEIFKTCEKIHKKHQHFFFSSGKFANKISEWNIILKTLSRISQALIAIHQNSSAGCLFSLCDSFDSELTRTLKEVDQRPFYGQNIGFHICSSMQPIVKFLAVSVACYFKFYFDTKPKIFRFLQFGVSFIRLYLDSQKRSEKIVKAYEKSTVKFCKSFWFLTEGSIAYPLMRLLAPKVEVDEIFTIEPKGLQIQSETGNDLVDIPIPKSHLGLKPIQCRLLSARRRKGMLDSNSKANTPRQSKHLIFHVHGGGFAAQTSKSHLSYLRKWAVDLDVPIISIDYSLTPEARFPRALEEVFFAYCWALKNSDKLGSTGENIVFVGDSAGGNLISACTIKCIEMGVRKPKGLLNIYPAVSLNFSDSPSRFFTVIDPILPFGFISRMSKEYAAVFDENQNNLQIPIKGKPQNQFKSPEEEFNVKVNEDYLVSPYNAPDEILANFPPTSFVAAQLDPCLDDSIEFAKKLKKNGVEITLDVMKNLPHGFLYFSNASKECSDAVNLCAERVYKFL